MAGDQRARALTVGALLIAGLALSGCATSIADMPLAGVPADAPARPKDPGEYLPVHDLPPDREEAVISPEERAKIQKDLIRARDHQATATKDTKAAK